jgi:membrane protein
MAGLLDRVSKTLAISLIARQFVGGHDAGPGVEPRPPETPPPAGAKKSVVALARTAVGRFIDDDAMTMAAALAYYTTFSMAPLLLIVIAIAGLIFGRDVVQQQITSQVHGLIGAGAATQVGAMMQNASEHSKTGVLSAVLGFLALLFGATGAFTQLQSSLDRIWRVKPDPQAGGIKNFLGQRVLSLGMILAIAFLLMVSLALSAALSAFGAFISSYLPQGFSAPVLQLLGQLGSLVVIATMFAAMFKVLPDAKINWRQAWSGAIITAVLFSAGKYLIGVYLGHSSTASAYGAAGSLVLIVLWVYYSSLILLLGAEFTVVRTEAQVGAIQPKAGAVKVHVEEVEHRPRHAA